MLVYRKKKGLTNIYNFIQTALAFSLIKILLNRATVQLFTWVNCWNICKYPNVNRNMILEVFSNRQVCYYRNLKTRQYEKSTIIIVFQKRVVRTKLDTQVFITISETIPLLMNYKSLQDVLITISETIPLLMNYKSLQDVFITISETIPLLMKYQSPRISSAQQSMFRH